MNDIITVDVTILKKNRKYFAATRNGYKCRIIVDSKSDSLTPGDHTIAVFDRTVRTKYGVDVVYELASDAADQAEPTFITIKSKRYNSVFVARAKKLGGRWDAKASAWVFPSFVEDEVDELDFLFNDDEQAIEFTVVDDNLYGHQDPVELIGYTIASATGRDSGAEISDGIAFIEGGVRSGGSVKNWTTVVEEGSVFRMSIPRAWLRDAQDWYIDDGNPDLWSATINA